MTCYIYMINFEPFHIMSIRRTQKQRCCYCCCCHCSRDLPPIIRKLLWKYLTFLTHNKHYFILVKLDGFTRFYKSAMAILLIGPNKRYKWLINILNYLGVFSWKGISFFFKLDTLLQKKTYRPLKTFTKLSAAFSLKSSYSHC